MRARTASPLRLRASEQRCRRSTSSSRDIPWTPSNASPSCSPGRTTVRDVLDRLVDWWGQGERIAVGTVVRTWSSAPRPPGAVMLVGPGGEAVGSVSGGCVEGAVYQLGEEILESGEPVLQRYGVSDESAFAVGLTCGGRIDIFVERVGKT